MRLLYYNPLLMLTDEALEAPGARRLARYHSELSIGGGIMLFDRTGAVRSPVRLHSIFPIPAMRAFPHTLEEVCDKRAKELIARADRLDAPLYVLWSGGIDSTCMLVSLLKAASPSERRNITVLLTEKSILENPAFYHEHIRGKLAITPSTMFHYMLGTKALLVSAEMNDIVFGSDFVRPMMKRFGFEKVFGPFDRELVREHFKAKLAKAPDPDKEAAFYLDIFERVAKKAPMPLPRLFDRLWWWSFATKWQFISVRMLAFTAARNAHLITPEYVRDYYAHFYDTEDFQLWSMNNLDKRIKDDWKSYKYPCKDIIFAYDGNADYHQNKTKKGSLSSLVVQQDPFAFVDDGYRLHRTLPAAEYLDANNDFV